MTTSRPCWSTTTPGASSGSRWTTDPALLVSLRGIRHEALRLATPLAQYVAEHNITEERTQAA